MKEVKIIDDKRIIIKNNNYNPFSTRKEWLGVKNKKQNKYMSIENYKKTIRRWRDKIYEFSIENEKCVELTLKFNKPIQWEQVIRKFNIFLKNIRKMFNQKIDYIRAIEVHKISKIFHIHLILIFNKYRPELSAESLQQIWKFGDIFIDENVFDIYGFVEYLTLFKNGCYQNDVFTYFPDNAKIISSNLKPSKNIRIITISDEHCDFVNNYYKTNSSKDIHCTGHCFYDAEKNKKCYVADKYYIKSSKEFVYSNFGTKEDDEIIEKLNEQKNHN